jgi:flagellar biosynthesis chaperone FliJ
LTTYEKAIHLQNKPLIPRDIIESDLSLQSYLEQNVIENRKDEKIRQRIAKAKHTRINHSLEAAARQIKVTPSYDAESVKQYQEQHPSVVTASETEQKYKTFIQARGEIERKARKRVRKVEPGTTEGEIKRVDICKQQEPREGSLVIEQIKASLSYARIVVTNGLITLRT